MQKQAGGSVTLSFKSYITMVSHAGFNAPRKPTRYQANTFEDWVVMMRKRGGAGGRDKGAVEQLDHARPLREHWLKGRRP